MRVFLLRPNTRPHPSCVHLEVSIPEADEVRPCSGRYPYFRRMSKIASLPDDALLLSQIPLLLPHWSVASIVDLGRSPIVRYKMRDFLLFKIPIFDCFHFQLPSDRSTGAE